jgi:hypothetical protein
VSRSPSVKARLAASTRRAPSSSGSWLATLIAPPRGVTSSFCDVGGYSGRKIPLQARPINSGSDTSQDGEAQCSSQLAAGLRNPGSRPGLLRRRRPDDQLGRQRHHRGETQGDDDRPGHHYCKTGRHADPHQHA